MELRYMQELKDNPNLKEASWSENKSMTDEEVKELEIKYNNGSEFPLAFKEFLIVAGKNNGLDVVMVSEDFEEIKEDCEGFLENTGYELNRPYFVFDSLDSQYSIFFLDEEKEDSDIYIRCLCKKRRKLAFV